jgi:hypothetical protein
MKDPCKSCSKRKQCKKPGECSEYQKYWTGQERTDNLFYYRKNVAVKTEIPRKG